ncbi:MAG: multidrug ABC transporter permease, partial [Alphaproteobacteria bacterium]
MTFAHSLLAIRALGGREIMKFLNQRGRLVSALVRPVLWLLVFAAG